MLTLAGVRLVALACPVKLKLVGFTVSTGVCGFTVKLAEAFTVGSAWLVAVTVTGVAIDTVWAVNKPDELTTPAVADQVTAVFEVLPTVAVNCCFAPETRIAVKGEVETLTEGAVDKL